MAQYFPGGRRRPNFFLAGLLMVIVSCALVYTAVCAFSSAVGTKVGLSDRRRRMVDASAGGMILMAAGFMAAK